MSSHTERRQHLLDTEQPYILSQQNEQPYWAPQQQPYWVSASYTKHTERRLNYFAAYTEGKQHRRRKMIGTILSLQPILMVNSAAGENFWEHTELFFRPIPRVNSAAGEKISGPYWAILGPIPRVNSAAGEIFSGPYWAILGPIPRVNSAAGENFPGPYWAILEPIPKVNSAAGEIFLGYTERSEPGHTEQTDKNPVMAILNILSKLKKMRSRHTEQKNWFWEKRGQAILSKKMGFEKNAVKPYWAKKRVLRKMRSTPRSDHTGILSKLRKTRSDHIPPYSNSGSRVWIRFTASETR